MRPPMKSLPQAANKSGSEARRGIAPLSERNYSMAANTSSSGRVAKVVA